MGRGHVYCKQHPLFFQQSVRIMFWNICCCHQIENEPVFFLKGNFFFFAQFKYFLMFSFLCSVLSKIWDCEIYLLNHNHRLYIKNGRRHHSITHWLTGSKFWSHSVAVHVPPSKDNVSQANLDRISSTKRKRNKTKQKKPHPTLDTLRFTHLPSNSEQTNG